MSRGTRITAALVAATAFCMVAGVVAWEFNKAREMADYSAQMALFEEAEQLLEGYRAEHGAYPMSLDALNFTFPDGGDQSTLDSVEYTSDGETYSFVIRNNSGEAHWKSQ